MQNLRRFGLLRFQSLQLESHFLCARVCFWRVYFLQFVFGPVEKKEDIVYGESNYRKKMEKMGK